MEVSLLEAKNLLGIQSMQGITERELKRIYRERIKKVHPDSGGSADDAAKVTLAYTCLQDAIKNGVKEEKVVNVQDVNEDTLYEEFLRRKRERGIKTIRLNLREYLSILSGVYTEVDIDGERGKISLTQLLAHKYVISDKIRVRVTVGSTTYRLEKQIAFVSKENVKSLEANICVEQEFKELGIEKCSNIVMRVSVGEVSNESVIETKRNSVSKTMELEGVVTVNLRIER